MYAILPLNLPAVDEPQIGFVHQRRCLEDVARPFSSHVASCDPVQLTVDNWNQPFECKLVACIPRQ
jgi:hypothetical protein